MSCVVPFIFLSLVPPTAGPDAPRAAIVLAVHDGDTCRLTSIYGIHESVRILGIDSPEIRQGRPGVAARDWLARHATVGSVVYLVPDSHHPRDPYGRTLAHPWTIRDGFLNVAEVRAGMAFAWTPAGKAHPDHWAAVQAAEAEARRYKRGVWKIRGLTRPWDWRRQHRGRSGR
jgi:micrococcal nuclease